MKLAFVTGGSKGLGRELVEQLAENDWQVVEFSRSGSSEHNIRCDLGDSESIVEISQSVFGKFASKPWKRIVFINNAAILLPIKFVANLKDEEIAQNIAINQVSAFIFMSEFIKVFTSHDAKKLLVNVSSGAARKGYPGWSLYCASKAALEMFIQTLVQEQQNEEFPITAINYNPGVIDTDMQGSIRNTNIKDFPLKQRFIDFKDNGDLSTPQVVAAHLLTVFDRDLISGESYSIFE